jgi:hypothetical protein
MVFGMWRRVSCYLNTNFKRNPRLLNCPIFCQVHLLRPRYVFTCYCHDVQSGPWRICQIHMLMPCLCLVKYFMSMWHVSTCHSYVVIFAVTCDVMYNVLKLLAHWIYLLHWLCTSELFLKEHMFAFICLHDFSQWEDHGRWWVLVLQLMLTVFRHWLLYVFLQAEIKAGMRTSTQHCFKYSMVCLSKWSE